MLFRSYFAFNCVEILYVTDCMQSSADNEETRTRKVQAAAAAMAAFRPENEIEGMLAAQAVALHFTTLEALKRAAVPAQPFDVASRLRKDAANLGRAMIDCLDGLARLRGKARQTIRVERVVIENGGKAILANVAGGAVGVVALIDPGSSDQPG